MRKFADGQVVETTDGKKWKVLWTCSQVDYEKPIEVFVKSLCGKRIKKKIPINQVKACTV